jgi:hypothetical protein
MNRIVGAQDILFVTLDTLRFDVAERLCAEGRTPNLAALLPGGKWELRHTPGSFTYAAHAAFFAGFLPSPASPGRHERLFALSFEGSTTTASKTCVFDGAADIVAGLRGRGYHTACIGGVGFFNQKNPLGRVFPSLFDEAHWSPELGVTEPRSTENQVALAQRIMTRVAGDKRLFLFINVSALHQPNRHYVEGATEDSIATHAAALEYVDRSLAPLFASARARAKTFCIVCSDHGTAYGDDGYSGHRLAHPSVWNVPYAEFTL